MTSIDTVDLRSDTVTRPTAAMRAAMHSAEVGDDVYGEDPTVNRLERRVAELLDFEAAVFVATGTMANLIAVMVHCHERGSEIVVGDRSHVHVYEQGAVASVAGVHSRVVRNTDDGCLDLDEVRQAIRPASDVHFPVTRLICVENTHNMCGGRVLSAAYMAQLVQLARAHSLPVHVDGARLLNAAVALRVAPRQLVAGCSSATLCLSKSLAAPVGTVLAGSAAFVARARRRRKALGGGWRQAGVVAAAGLVALDTMVARLAEDHEAARRVARAVHHLHLDTVQCDWRHVDSNIVLLTLSAPLTAPAVCTALGAVSDEEQTATGRRVAVLAGAPAPRHVRLVFHADVTSHQLSMALVKLEYVLRKVQSSTTTTTTAADSEN